MSRRRFSRLARHAIPLGLVTAIAAVAAAVAPAGASAFSKAIWGQITRNGVNQFPLYRQLGVSIYQMGLNWNQVAPTRPANPTNPADPAYHWPTDVPEAIRFAAQYRIRVMLQLVNAPAWADGGHVGAGWAPRNPADFAAFAQAAARKYPSVHLWMVWGEPTKRGNFQPIVPAAGGGVPLDRAQRAAPHRYAQMLDDAYGALKHVSRANRVIGGSTYTTGLIDAQQWIENLRLPDGKPPRMDMYAHNPFSYQAPDFSARPTPFGEVQFSDLKRLESWIQRYLHRSLPLFLSEFTIPTAPDNTFNFWVEPTLAASWIKDALRLSRHWKDIYALGWINVYDDLPITSGGLLTASGKPKPGFYAFEGN